MPYQWTIAYSDPLDGNSYEASDVTLYGSLQDAENAAEPVRQKLVDDGKTVTGVQYNVTPTARPVVGPPPEPAQA